MNNTSIQHGMISILMNMGIAEKAITKNASFQKDLGLDSLDFAELIIEIELAFGIEIPELEAENIKTIKHAIRYINSHLELV